MLDTMHPSLYIYRQRKRDDIQGWIQTILWWVPSSKGFLERETMPSLLNIYNVWLVHDRFTKTLRPMEGNPDRFHLIGWPIKARFDRFTSLVSNKRDFWQVPLNWLLNSSRPVHLLRNISTRFTNIYARQYYTLCKGNVAKYRDLVS